MNLDLLTSIPLPVFLVLLLEVLLYLLPANLAFRNLFAKLPRWLQATFIFLSGLLPVLLLNAVQGRKPADFPLLAAALGIVCMWFFVLPQRPLVDALLLALLASFILVPWFQPLFPSPTEKLKLGGALNKLLWMRIGMMLFLFPRRFAVPGLGLWPERRDWIVGLHQTLIFFAILLPITIYLKILRFQLPKVEAWILPLLTIVTFFAFLYFVAMGEEFLLRGVLQQVLSKELGGPWRGLIVASLCFGIVHLPYRAFPNWRFAAMSALAGCFYGLAFNRAKSLRAAMVSHALVNTVWTILFSRSL